MSKKKIDFPSRAARRDYLLKKELSGGGGSVDIVTENTSSVEFSGNGSKDFPLKAEAVGLGSAATVDVVQGTGSSSNNVMSQKATTDALATKVDTDALPNILSTKADKSITIEGVGSLTGGGDLSANRSLDLTSAAKDSLQKANTSVQPNRKVVAGTGLEGGGDLSTDRTLSVDFGTTAGKVAQGNDSRIVNALQKGNNLSDVTNPATARNNLGLGEAATRDVGEELGNVLGVGSFGIGGRGRDLAMDEDIQQVPTGIYTMQNGHPQNEWEAGMTLIVSRSGGFGTYIACHTSSNKVYYASGDESASLDWGELVFLSDVQRIVDEAVDRALNQ